MSTIKNVLVVGATGNIGPTIIHALTTANFNISILTRLSSPNTPPPNPNIPLITTDYTPSSLANAFKNQDAIISTIGPAGKRAQIALIDAAVLAGVQRFIPSDYSYKTYDMAGLERRVPAIHQRLVEMGNVEVLDYCREMAARYVGFTWTALGGGLLFDWTSKINFLGTSLPLHITTIIDSGNEPFLTVTIPQIALAIIRTLQNPSSTVNKYLDIHSFVLTQHQVLSAAEKVTGHKFEVTFTDAETNRKEGEELLAKGDIRGLGKLWGSFFWEDGRGGGKDVGDGNKILGLEEEDLEEVISKIVGVESE